jgi:hypothetical protein
MTSRPTLRQRAEVIDHRANLTDEEKQFMSNVRRILGNAARELADLVDNYDGVIDQGTAHRAIQKVQSSKDTMCTAIVNAKIIYGAFS